MKILVVDDDPIILELLTQLIQGLGDHDVETAESGQEALDLIDSNMSRFDCFLLDIQMPSMDGITLTKELRKTGCYADAPILMLTAMTDKRYIDAAFAARASDYITKPFDMTELRMRLDTIADSIAQRCVETIHVEGPVSTAPNSPMELYAHISIYDVENVIDYTAMENYVAQLSRGAIFGSTTFAFSLRDAARHHEQLSAFEFHGLICDLAEVISDLLSDHQFLMSYAGNGTFVCVTESGWRPDTAALTQQINQTLKTSETYDNAGNLLYPQVSTGQAQRLIWKKGEAVLDALAAAHASAEAACAASGQTRPRLWSLRRPA